MMSAGAQQFITPLTLQTLSGHPVATDTFDLTQESEIGHIRLADSADAVVIAPATANVIGKLAAGIADDLITTVLLAVRAPVVLAPAMNVNMWENPIVQANLSRAAGARLPRRRARRGLPRLRLGRQGPLARHARAGRRNRARPQRPGPARRVRAGDRRAESRAHRSGALHLESLDRQDGLCGGRRGVAARRRGHAGGRPDRPAHATRRAPAST